LSRDRVFHLLDAKGYSAEQIAVYIKAFDYFWENPDDFDDYYSKRPYGCAWHRLGRCCTIIGVCNAGVNKMNGKRLVTC
jgi:peptide methionine sulfoxide reductase MsrA